MENELSSIGMESNKERLSRDIGGMVSEASEAVKDYSNRKLATARETLSQAQNVVSDTARQYADVTDEYVRANPWKALGVAAAAGVLVGILLGRR